MSEILSLTPTDRVLVVAPHQDDEAIGCGGAISYWRSNQVEVGVLWISATTDGEAISAEARASAGILGLTWLHGLGISPIGVNNDATTLARVVAAMREFAPTVVVIPHEDEDDRQHHITARLGAEATWIASYDVDLQLGAVIPAIRMLLAYEVWTPLRRPTCYLDISAFEKVKRAALAEYRSQELITPIGDGALGLNRYRAAFGLGHGAYAEAFAVMKAR